MRAAGRPRAAAAATPAAQTPAVDPAAAPAAVAAERGFSPVEETQIARLVEQAYLRTLTRPPRPEEAARAVAHFQELGDLTAGARDLLWALVNTKEFVVNH
jgi:hypothetical protein